MPEFNRTAKVTYEFAGIEYWVTVNEYGASKVRCFEGRGQRWGQTVKPGKTLRETFDTSKYAWPGEEWIARLDAAIADLRVLVES